MTGQSPARGGRREDVLALLRAASKPLSIADIAARLSIHPNTVRFHLDVLIGESQAERLDITPTGPGRPRQMFRAHVGMDPAGPRNYRLLADILITQLSTESHPTARAIDAGRAWGKRLGATTSSRTPTEREAADELRRIMDDLGFAPEPDEPTSNTRINLRHCPFLDVTEGDTSIVCPIHLGLMRGVLEAWSAPITVDRLVPFAEPDLCRAHLAPASGSRR